jgi:prepilin-type N-terminal cleavage/methylation domain-containing protein
MTASPSLFSRRSSGFTLTEALLTMAIIGIISSIVVSAMSSAAKDASRMVARQQQAQVQNAVNAWISGQTRDLATGQVRSLESIRGDYNSRGTSLARFNLISGYLDESTADHFTDTTTNSDRVKSEAMINARQYLTLGTWVSGSYPKVELTYE